MAKTKHVKERSEFLVTISANKEAWRAEQEKAFKKLSSELNLKGFRKGQVPAEIARKSTPQSSIFANAVQKMADILVKETEKHMDKTLSVLDSPTYRVEKISENELELTFVFPVYPEIKLGDYKNLNVMYEVQPLKDDEVELEITKILSGKSKVEPKAKGSLEKGDIAVFDFKGFVDGKAFEGGEADNYELEVGSGQFIAGFEDQMIGMEIGDERHVVAQFPDDYPVAELAGKQAVFVVNLRGMKHRAVPKLTDEIATSLKINGVKTSKDLHAYLEDTLKMRNIQTARERFQQQAFDLIRKDMQVVVPQILLEKEEHAQQDQFANNLRRQQMDVKQYMKYTGQNEEGLRTYFRGIAERRLKDALIFAELGRLENIQVSEKDYDKMYERYSKIYGQSIDATKGVITKAQLQIPLMNEKVIDFLISTTSGKKHATKEHTTEAQKPAKASAKSHDKHDHDHAGHDHAGHDHSAHDHDHTAHAKPSAKSKTSETKITNISKNKSSGK